jgi:hypothetical protein
MFISRVLITKRIENKAIVVQELAKHTTSVYSSKNLMIEMCIYLWIMLTSVSGTLVKNTKINNFCIKNCVLHIYKSSITQVPRIFYHILAFSYIDTKPYIVDSHEINVT